MTVIEPFPLDYSRKISYFTMVIGISSNSTPPIKAMAPQTRRYRGIYGVRKIHCGPLSRPRSKLGHRRGPGSQVAHAGEFADQEPSGGGFRRTCGQAREIRFDLLGAAAFGSEAALIRLNTIVHPPLVKILEERLSERNDRPVILDAALLPLWRIEPLFDACLWVRAPAEMRLRRILAGRPDLDEAAARGRMRLQEMVLPEPAPGFSWLHIDNSESRERLSEALIGFQCGG